MTSNCCDTSSFCGCGIAHQKKSAETERELIISWQRLISEGSTCPRCGSTEDELEKAFTQLEEMLKPKGVSVILEKKELTLEEFKQRPLESNRILINGRLLEYWLSAKTRKSKCCDVCGDKECRTIEMGEKNYETIPASLIVEAGLKAVSVK